MKGGRCLDKTGSERLTKSAPGSLLTDEGGKLVVIDSFAIPARDELESCEPEVAVIVVVITHLRTIGSVPVSKIKDQNLLHIAQAPQ